MTRCLLVVLFIGAGLSVGWSAPTVLPAEPSDALGDPLPPYALLRVGTVRFRHGGSVAALVVSPDGKTVVSSGADAMVRVWDLASGKELRQWSDNNSAFFDGSPLAVAPNGKKLAYCDSKIATVCDPHTGQRSYVLAKLLGVPKLLAYVDNGNSILYLEWDQTIHLLDANSGEEQSSFSIDVHDDDGPVIIREGTGWAPKVALSPDGTLLLTIEFGHGWVWNVATGERVGKFGGDCRYPTVLAVSPDKRRYAWADQNGEVILGQLSGEEVRFFTPDAGETMRTLIFSPDSKQLACGSDSGIVSIHATDTGKQLCRINAHGGRVTCLTYTPDGKTLVSGGDDGCVRVWDAATGTELVHTHSHRGATAVALSPDGTRLATTGAGQSLQTWAMDSGTELRSFDLQRTPVERLFFSPDGVRLTAVTDAELRAWAVETGQSRRPIPYQYEDSRSYLSPDGRLAIRADRERKLFNLIRVADGRQLGLSKREALATAAIYSSDISWVGVYWRPLVAWDRPAEPKEFSVFEVASGKELYRWQPPAAEAPVAFTPDKALVVCGFGWDFGYGGKTIRLRVVGTWERLPVFDEDEDPAKIVALAPDGNTLVTGSEDGTLTLWEMATGKRRGVLKGHRGKIVSLEFNNDGRRLASGSNDSTALLWNLHAAAIGHDPAPRQLTKQALDGLWADLRSDDAAVAYRAVHVLGASPAEAVPYLRARLRPATVETDRVARLIGDLDSPKFAVREKASAELAELAELAEPLLRGVAKEPPSAEVRRRVQDLLATVKTSPYVPTGERLRSWRALEALELCGTLEVRDVLAALAKGDDNARLTGEAKQVLERLRQCGPATTPPSTRRPQ